MVNMLSLQYTFFIVNVMITIYILIFKKRKFDFISIYVLILFLYSTPVLFGVVINVYTQTFEAATPDLFVVMSIPYLIVSLFLIANNNYEIISRRSFVTEKIALNVFLISSLIAISAYIPTLLSSASKVELLENSNLFSMVLYQTLPVAGFLLSLKSKSKKFLIIFSLILLFMLIFGGRKSVTAAFLAGAVIFLENKPLRLIEKYKFILISCLLLIVLVLSKTLYGFVLSAGPIEGFKAWVDRFEFRYLLTGSEFLGRSSLLEAVLVNDFKTDKIYYFYSFLALLPIPLSYFNYSSSYFNDQFQPALFPSIEYGMAYNIWAEAYSAFGYIGIICISAFIPFILQKLWKLYTKSNTVFSVIVLLIGVTIAFWIQRNSLATIFAYTRNILYPMVIIYFIVIVVKSLISKKA